MSTMNLDHYDKIFAEFERNNEFEELFGEDASEALYELIDVEFDLECAADEALESSETDTMLCITVDALFD